MMWFSLSIAAVILGILALVGFTVWVDHREEMARITADKSTPRAE